MRPSVTVLAYEDGAPWVKYIHGDLGKGAWTYLGGHDPEDPQHNIGAPPTDLALHPNSPGYRLILNNVLFSTQLAEACAVHGVRGFINVGTSWQHYRDAEYDPVCLYAATKQAFEAILRYYVETAGLKVVTLLFFDTYGPGDRRPKLFSLLRRVAEGGERIAMSPGEQLLDLVYVDDVVEAMLVARRRLESGAVTSMERYSVSSGNPVSLREVAALYGKVVGKPLAVDWGGRPYRRREVMVPWSMGERLPGWRPCVTLEEGLRRMVRDDV